jgi:hypothetical protein
MVILKLDTCHYTADFMLNIKGTIAVVTLRTTFIQNCRLLLAGTVTDSFLFVFFFIVQFETKIEAAGINTIPAFSSISAIFAVT